MCVCMYYIISSLITNLICLFKRNLFLCKLIKSE